MARANRVREIWAEGKAVINNWLGVPSSFSAEVMAHAGWDSQMDDRPIDPTTRPDNLAAPLPGDRGAHGDFDSRSRSGSGELWIRLNAGKLAAGAAAAAATALVAWRGLRG